MSPAQLLAGILERVVEALFFLPPPPPFLLAGFALEEGTARLHTFLIIFRRAGPLGGTVVSVVAGPGPGATTTPFEAFWLTLVA